MASVLQAAIEYVEDGLTDVAASAIGTAVLGLLSVVGTRLAVKLVNRGVGG